MAGAGGSEVGRINIRVVPDLDQFRAQLLAELEALEKRGLKIKVELANAAAFKAEVESAAKGVTATVDVDANTKGVREKIKAAAAGTTAKVEVEVDDAGSFDRWQRRMQARVQSAFSKMELSVPLTAGGEADRTKNAASESALQKILALEIPLDFGDAASHRSEIQKGLEKIERSIPPVPVKIELETDYSTYKRGLSILERSSKLRPQLDTSYAGFRNGLRILTKTAELKIRPVLDEKASWELKKRLAALDDEVAKRNQDVARASADKLMLRPDFQAISPDFKPITQEELVKYKADLDTSLLEIKLNLLEQKLAHEKVEVRIKPDADMGAFARVKFGIEALFSNITVKIKTRRLTADDLLPDVAGAAGAAAKGLANVGASAGGSLPSLFSFAGILMLIVAAIAILLPPVLALAAGFVTLVPAVLALIAPIGAVMLGLGGIKKAAENAGLFADSNGDKKGGGGVGAALDAIREKVSATFEKGLTPAFEKLGGMFEAITEPMDRVAQGLVDMGTGFIEAVTQGPGLENIKSIISNIGTGLTNAAPGIRDFTDAMLELVEGISNKFPGLGTWFSGIMADFKASMVDFTAPGEDGMSRLDQLIANVRIGIEGLTSVFQAFWNQGLSDIQSPSFGQGMKDFFAAVKTFVAETLPSLSSGFKDIADLMNTLSPLFKAINFLGNGAGFITDIVGGGDANTKAAANRMEESRRAGGSFYDQWKAGAMGSGDPYEGLVDAATPAGAAAGQKFAEGAKPWTQPLPVGAAVDGSQNLMTSLKLDAPEAAPPKSTNPQVAALIESITSSAPLIQAAVDTSMAPLKTLPETMGAAFAGLTGVFQTAWAPLAGIVQTACAGVLDVVVITFGGLVNTVSTYMSAIPTLVGNAFTGAANSITGSMSSMLNAVVTGGANIITEIAGWPARVVTAVGNLSTTLTPAGEQLAAGLGTGLKSGMDKVLAYASTIAGLIAAVKGPLPKDRTTLVPAGEALMQGLDDGMQGGLQTVLDNAARMSQQISDAVNNGMDVTGMQEDIKKTLSDLQIQNDALKVQRDTIPKENKDARKAVTNQMDRISVERNKLNLFKDQNAAQLKLNKAEEDKMKPWMDAGKDAMSSALNVGQSVMDSFTQDLGISGSGALSVIGKSLIGSAASTASNFIFNTSNPDETMALFKSQQTQDSLQYTQR
jgi:phage-related protein